LNAEGHRVENEQDARHNLQVENKPFVECAIVVNVGDGNEKVESNGRKHKPDKPVAKNDLHIVFHHFPEQGPNIGGGY
jgi:hypothetical protein